MYPFINEPRVFLTRLNEFFGIPVVAGCFENRRKAWILFESPIDGPACFQNSPQPRKFRKNRLNKAAIFTVLLLCSCLGFNVFATTLNTINIQNQPDKMVILCKLSNRPAYKVLALHQPERLVIDLDQVVTRVDLGKFKSNLFIKQVRVGHPDAKTLRVVFDMNQPVLSTASTWQSQAQQPSLKIEVKLIEPTKPTAMLDKSVSSSTATSSLNQKLLYQSHAPRGPLRDVIVVIDPGHGGKDPGAIGLRHSQEKQIVLNIAQQLKRQIDSQPGMRAVLTRRGDYYVGLRERMAIARKYNGDIFVAIHADAYDNHHSRGASIFALSQRGATSEAARWLAEKENYSELGGVNLKGLDDRSGVIRTVLIDLSQTATISASLQMGSQVLYRLNKMTTLHSNKVEQARFMVLKSPDIPSILIETGFISNPREEMNLNNRIYQARLTEAIFNGIKGYFWDYPPHGSRLEAMVNAGRRVAFVNQPHRHRRPAG